MNEVNNGNDGSRLYSKPRMIVDSFAYSLLRLIRVSRSFNFNMNKIHQRTITGKDFVANFLPSAFFARFSLQ